MSTALPSDEVAEDYKNALDDLMSNDRYQIANLTMIAKENIEHAEAISRVLTNHINRVSPSRKLPALYVLDSLVKNIGSPYTVYFGRSLHATFMLAYSQVDANIRRKLEEMLRTWREPIPGSLSTTPVFPMQSTQSIVDTLNKYRATATPAAQRGQLPPNQTIRSFPAQAYRNTPTPPQMQNSMPVPASTSVAATSMLEFAPHVINSRPQGYNTPPPQHQPTFNSNVSSSSARLVNVAELHAHIDDLTTDAKIECTTHPMDNAAQRKLATLQTLKELLDTGLTSEQDLMDIRQTINLEMEKKAANSQRVASMAAAAPPPNMHHYLPHTSTPQPTMPIVPTPSFINQNNLADLLRLTAATPSISQTPDNYANAYPGQNHQTPAWGMASALPTITNPASQPPPAIPVATLPLLDQLRKSGLLSSALSPAPPANPTPMNQSSAALVSSETNVPFTSASIRLHRPHLVKQFLNQRTNQCTTCGKRFQSDDIGKQKKARHLDWHFKTKARMLEAEKRGQNRSWYVDEREWISSKEIEDDAEVDVGASAGTAASAAEKAKQQEFVRVPTDPALRNAPCPIDQEPFKSEWSEEVQDFIWKDAIRVGQRYYHASCYREATKDRGKDGLSVPNTNGTARTTTPDSVLGKRKAEHDLEANVNSKIKFEA